MAQYEGKAIIPIQEVAGEIAIPLVRMEASQKCAKGVYLLDLAKYLDARIEAARIEMAALIT